MLDTCSIIIRKPLGNEQATLGIRAAFAMQTNAGLPVKVVLMGDGLYSVLSSQGYVKELFGRFMGEDGEVYAILEDMAERGLSEDQMPDGIMYIAASEVSELVLETDSVMTF